MVLPPKSCTWGHTVSALTWGVVAAVGLTTWRTHRSVQPRKKQRLPWIALLPCSDPEGITSPGGTLAPEAVLADLQPAG